MLSPRLLGGILLLLAFGVAPLLGCRAGLARECGGLRVECRRYYITDYDTKPEVWPQAYVSVSSLTSELRLKGQPDSLGVVMFECLPPGAYRVRLDQLPDPVPEYDAFACDTFVVGKRDTTRATITLFFDYFLTPEGPKGSWGTWKP